MFAPARSHRLQRDDAHQLATELDAQFVKATQRPIGVHDGFQPVVRVIDRVVLGDRGGGFGDATVGQRLRNPCRVLLAQRSQSHLGSMTRHGRIIAARIP